MDSPPPSSLPDPDADDSDPSAPPVTPPAPNPLFTPTPMLPLPVGPSGPAFAHSPTLPRALIHYGPSSAANPTADRRYGGAFWISALGHGLALGIVILLALELKKEIEDQPAIFELVQGEGDNFSATEAPSGHEAGQAAQGEIDFKAPEIPTFAPPPAPPAATPVEPEPTPVTPITPVEAIAPPPTKPAIETPPVPDLRQTVKTKIREEKRKADREIKKQREVDKKAAAEAAKRTSFDQFQKQQGSAKTPGTGTPTNKGTSTPGPRVDANGIKKGVTGGTGAQSGGAGGTALARAEADAMAEYMSLLVQRLRENHEKPGGLSDLLNTQVSFTITASGALTNVQILRPSGNADFDQSVREAIARVKMPPRPDKKSESRTFTFRMKEE